MTGIKDYSNVFPVLSESIIHPGYDAFAERLESFLSNLNSPFDCLLDVKLFDIRMVRDSNS